MKNQKEKIEGVLRIYEKLNIRQLTENEILTFYRNAINYIDSIDLQKNPED